MIIKEMKRMKRTIRKIAIVLSMGMMLVLLTSWYSYTLQLPSGLAAGIVINPNNQQQIPLEDNGNVPKESGSTSDTADDSIKNTVDKFRELKDKAPLDPSVGTPDIDREKIQQEIDESINSIDENALPHNNLKFSNNAGSETLKHVSTAANELIDSWDPKTGVDTLESSLQELANREGVTLNIEDTDTITISYVHAGKTYTTSTNIKNVNFMEALYNSCHHRYSNGVCTICGKACENSFHAEVCPWCGENYKNTVGNYRFGVYATCNNPFHSEVCPECGMAANTKTTGSAISQGHPEIVFGIGGLAVGFLAAMLIFRKRNSTPATAKDKADEIKNNNDEI